MEKQGVVAFFSTLTEKCDSVDTLLHGKRSYNTNVPNRKFSLSKGFHYTVALFLRYYIFVWITPRLEFTLQL